MRLSLTRQPAFGRQWLLCATPAGTAPREVPQEGPQGQLVVGGHRWRERWVERGWPTTMTGPALGHPELPSEVHDGPPAAVRGQKFPRLSSFNMSMSSACGHELLQAQLLRSSSQPLGVVGLHSPVLVPPAVPGRLGDLEVAVHLIDLLALAEELVALGELADHLLGCVAPSFHVSVLLPPSWGVGLAQRVDQSRVPGQDSQFDSGMPEPHCRRTRPS